MFTSHFLQRTQRHLVFNQPSMQISILDWDWQFQTNKYGATDLQIK
jgi:hypothetical protein